MLYYEHGWLQFGQKARRTFHPPSAMWDTVEANARRPACAPTGLGG